MEFMRALATLPCMRWLFLLALCASCATLKHDTTVCSEYRDLRCIAGAKCVYDRVRGCQVCHCASVNGATGADEKPTVNTSTPGR